MRNKRPWLGLSVWLWSGGPVQPDDQAQIHAHPKLLLAEDVLPFPFPLPQDLGYLVTKRKLEDEDNFEDWVNHHSKVGAAAAAWGRAMGVLLLRLGRAQSGAAWMAGGGAWLLLLVGKATWVLPLGAVEQTRRH